MSKHRVALCMAAMSDNSPASLRAMKETWRRDRRGFLNLLICSAPSSSNRYHVVAVRWWCYGVDGSFEAFINEVYLMEGCT